MKSIRDAVRATTTHCGDIGWAAHNAGPMGRMTLMLIRSFVRETLRGDLFTVVNVVVNESVGGSNWLQVPIGTQVHDVEATTTPESPRSEAP